MAAEPVVTIRKSFERSAPHLIEQLKGYPTGYFVDIQGRRGAMDCGIRPMFDFPPVIGAVVTVRTVPDDNLAPYLALDVVRPGDILVIACGDWTGSAVIGDLIVGMFKNAGVAAVVTDGAVRDIPGLETVGVPIFARALTPNSPQKNGPGAIGEDVSIGGVIVRSGDVIVGDRDGVVVLPRARVADAIGEVRGVKEKESRIEEAIAGGMVKADWLEDFLASDRVRVID